MGLSHRGIVADILWYEIKNHADNLELGEFVVMPNHVHGILILDDPGRDNACVVSTTAPTVIDNDKTIGQQRFQNQGKNTISSIVGAYKSAVTKHIRRLGFDFAWQPRFHDYVIRNDRAYDRIVEYIKNNPRNWNRDKFCNR